MRLVRIISQDGWNETTVSGKTLEDILIRIWQDPVANEILKALSHDRKICPVIEKWRKAG